MQLNVWGRQKLQALFLRPRRAKERSQETGLVMRRKSLWGAGAGGGFECPLKERSRIAPEFLLGEQGHTQSFHANIAPFLKTKWVSMLCGDWSWESSLISFTYL